MKFYQYPKCSTCVKARKYLELNRISVDSINIVEQAPSKSELELMLASYDGNIRKLFNTSGMQYRELNMKDRLPSMEVDQALDLLASNGMLVKRPFLLKDGKGIVGFKESDWDSFLG
ncbi:arsenate reductase family protein [Arenicella sp. 4NH20-0111]|uniref:arsenate reductase family protein n=1 Tax=Arenicella sp. 4NH20-0111 TaxID=3127648 RepID=UPI0031024DEC